MKPSEIFSMEDTFKRVVDPFTSEEPAVSSKLTIHKAGSEIGCAACSS